MKRNHILHVVLATVGIGALLAYLVACRPSWSPDGSKILFPYIHPATEVAGIALFDKGTGEARSIFVMPEKRSAPVEFMPWTQWAADGKSAIVVWAEDGDGEDKLHVRLQPVQSQEPARQIVIPGVEMMPGLPLAELDGNLFVGGKTIIRVDLKTGKTKRRKIEVGQEAILVGHKKQIHYLLGGGSGPASGYEVGTVDPEKLALEPWLKLKQADVGEVAPFFGVAADGSTLAVSSVKNQKCDLLIIAEGSLRKTIPLELSSETHVVGNLQWSPDGKTIYAALIAQVEGEELLVLGILEVTVETGATREVPLARLGKSTEREILPMVFQIGLSPDGKTIAAAPTYLGKELKDKKDLALHLVDLTSPDRKVTRIPVPTPGAPKE